MECENSLMIKIFPKNIMSYTSKSHITHPGNNQKIISKENWYMSWRVTSICFCLCERIIKTSNKLFSVLQFQQKLSILVPTSYHPFGAITTPNLKMSCKNKSRIGIKSYGKYQVIY